MHLNNLHLTASVSNEWLIIGWRTSLSGLVYTVQAYIWWKKYNIPIYNHYGLVTHSCYRQLYKNTLFRKHAMMLMTKNN